MGLKEATKEPLCWKCTAIWGCIMLIGIICLIVGIIQRSNLQPLYDDQLSNGIDCVIISVNQGNQCHQQKDGCLV